MKGRRYSKEQRREVVEFFHKHGQESALKKFKVSRESIRRWAKELEPKEQRKKSDVVSYLHHAEQDYLERLRIGKLKKPDRAHMLLSIALRELEGE